MKPISVFTCLCIWVTCAFAVAVPGPAVDPDRPNSEGVSKVQSRMDMIKELYAWSGFVYAIWDCPSTSKMIRDFSKMRNMGGRVVITFGYCGDGKGPEYYGETIRAAGQAGLTIIPLAWTLADGNGETFENTALPRVNAVTQAVIQNPDPVIAVAFGDEPLYDHDAPSATNLAGHIKQMKRTFSSVGLHDMPVSISELAYGWQITDKSDAQPLIDVLDFFMINSFPYFAFDAQSGGSDVSWKDFVGDLEYYEGIAKGKPLLVTQTGWPSNRNTWSPNSPDVVVSVESEKGFWDLLDGHCEDFFKSKRIGWMWRSFDDSIDGWGAFYSDGRGKWDVKARRVC